MIIKTMQNRLVTINKQLDNLEERAEPLLKEKAKIEAFLEDEAHEANVRELTGKP